MATSSTSSSSERASRLTAGARLHSSRRAVSLSQAARLGSSARAAAPDAIRRPCALTAQGSVTFCVRVCESERLLPETGLPALYLTSEVGLVAVPCVPAMHLPCRGNAVGSRVAHCVSAWVRFWSAGAACWPEAATRGSRLATASAMPHCCMYAKCMPRRQRQHGHAPAPGAGLRMNTLDISELANIGHGSRRSAITVSHMGHASWSCSRIHHATHSRS